MQSKEREETVLKYIESNQGCMSEDVVNGLEKFISRKIVFDILKNLALTGEIQDVSTNRRDNRYILNTSNEINILRNDLDSFKQSFYILVKRLFERPSISHLSDIKKSGLSRKEKIREIKAIKVETVNEFLQMTATYEKIKICMNQLRETRTTFKSISDPKTDPMDPSRHFFSLNTGKKVLKIGNRYIAQTNKLLLLINQYNDHMRKCEFFVIEYWLTIIFISFVIYFQMRAVIKWPYIVRDKGMISKLYKIVNEDTTVIATWLANILKHIPHLDMMKNEQFIDTIIFEDDLRISRMIHDFELLGLETEVREVLKGLKKDDYNELDFQELIGSKKLISELMSKLEPQI